MMEWWQGQVTWRWLRLRWRLRLVWDILWSPWNDIKDIRLDMWQGQAIRYSEHHGS